MGNMTKFQHIKIGDQIGIIRSGVRGACRAERSTVVRVTKNQIVCNGPGESTRRFCRDDGSPVHRYNSGTAYAIDDPTFLRIEQETLDADSAAREAMALQRANRAARYEYENHNFSPEELAFVDAVARTVDSITEQVDRVLKRITPATLAIEFKWLEARLDAAHELVWWRSLLLSLVDRNRTIGFMEDIEQHIESAKQRWENGSISSSESAHEMIAAREFMRGVPFMMEFRALKPETTKEQQ